MPETMPESGTIAGEIPAPRSQPAEQMAAANAEPAGPEPAGPEPAAQREAAEPVATAPGPAEASPETRAAEPAPRGRFAPLRGLVGKAKHALKRH
ncbi:hypothetical protein [Amycolatopsis sp. NPDC051061]|uniref:hypothetical protein n=1 Tax=Amycolatopsis sp. NPDC051061 TaxID=3155042 RepID=UPI003423E9D3